LSSRFSSKIPGSEENAEEEMKEVGVEGPVVLGESEGEERRVVFVMNIQPEDSWVGVGIEVDDCGSDDDGDNDGADGFEIKIELRSY